MPFRIALSGLNAASTDLKVTGNNISNSSTNGFKQSRAEFADVFAVVFGGTSGNASGNGVRVGAVSQQFTQGSIEFSERALDLAVSGQGFFVIENDGGQTYTRAGSFNIDRTGTVVNNKNQRLQVFPVVPNSTPGATVQFNTGVLNDLTLSTTDGPPNPTSTVTANINLDAAQTPPAIAPFDASDATSYTSSTSVIVYDELGSQHPATMYYVKTPTLNEWQTHLLVDGNEINNAATGTSPTTMVFNSDGTLQTPANGRVDYQGISAAALATGAGPLAMTINYAGSTQFGSNFSVNALSQDGYSSGRLSGIDIDDEGVVFARFTNGQSEALGQVAIATFPNEQGMRQLGDTTWSETFESGNVVVGAPGTGSLGLIQSGALEASNVDIAASLVGLITAQRNFQANAQVISTADTVTQTIINI